MTFDNFSKGMKKDFIIITHKDEIQYEKYSLGQPCLLQTCISSLPPTQGRPSPLGGGSLQLRLRDLRPPPQLALHWPQDDHWAQLPFTAEKNKQLLRNCVITHRYSVLINLIDISFC